MTTVNLRNCPRCPTPPQMFRAEVEGLPVWAIVCPECGYQLVGKRVEGLTLAGMDIIETLKTGDDSAELVTLWNNLEAIT